jgi:hypothetical protein
MDRSAVLSAAFVLSLSGLARANLSLNTDAALARDLSRGWAGSADTSARTPDAGLNVGSLRDQPESSSAEPQPAPTVPVRLDYGDKGTNWLTIGGGYAKAFNQVDDANLFVSWSHFLGRDVEFNVEGGLWHFNQRGKNAVGLNAAMVFRWHFYNQDPISLYLDTGIGLLVSTRNVPSGGTGFNLTPRVGGGMTWRLTDDGVRLQLGARWHHISNARIHGDDRNPSRDAPYFYAGLIFPL